MDAFAYPVNFNELQLHGAVKVLLFGLLITAIRFAMITEKSFMYNGKTMLELSLFDLSIHMSFSERAEFTAR